MHADFWHQRWQEGRIGFHQDVPTPLLVEHWPALALPARSRVFVPLAGKSLDMAWLAARGHRVLGVELSSLAVEQFFQAQGLEPAIESVGAARHYRAGDIELVCGDVFDLDPALLADCEAVFDRAALIALPAAIRQRYAREVYGRLPRGCRGLLVSLEYPPHEKQGPPFPVGPAEIDALFAADWSIQSLQRQDILAEQPRFIDEGVTTLWTAAYRLQRH
ncbi:thiopurine S-methyltransferase [Marilutibacter aestuarii]|uniref:Thiopurine S-methyltransferase n=1 Tax=Marilutibacter aestuarii TaxID=1706195 RepID=A0A508ANS4_9GAMM|nr:thiopurine S-methyltransferase [Lysobacter aestuarii]TQD51117.1 thiopurine S-methyltransferase [Lysobacter aestuarii]